MGLDGKHVMFDDSKKRVLYRYVLYRYVCPLLTRKDFSASKYAIKAKAVVYKYMYVTLVNKKRLLYEYICLLAIAIELLQKIKSRKEYIKHFFRW